MTSRYGTVLFQLEEGAIEPTRGTAASAGWDLSVSKNVQPQIVTATPLMVDTGVRVAIPEGCVGLIIQRSSLAKLGLFCNLGVIDSDYRGTIKLLLWSIAGTIHVFPEDRVAQLVVVPIVEYGAITAELSPTERGEGGFGSTG